MNQDAATLERRLTLALEHVAELQQKLAQRDEIIKDLKQELKDMHRNPTGWDGYSR